MCAKSCSVIRGALFHRLNSCTGRGGSSIDRFLITDGTGAGTRAGVASNAGGDWVVDSLCAALLDAGLLAGVTRSPSTTGRLDALNGNAGASSGSGSLGGGTNGKGSDGNGNDSDTALGGRSAAPLLTGGEIAGDGTRSSTVAACRDGGRTGDDPCLPLPWLAAALCVPGGRWALGGGSGEADASGRTRRRLNDDAVASGETGSPPSATPLQDAGSPDDNTQQRAKLSSCTHTYSRGSPSPVIPLTGDVSRTTASSMSPMPTHGWSGRACSTGS